jgi:hypothetical protein
VQLRHLTCGAARAPCCCCRLLLLLLLQLLLGWHLDLVVALWC